MINVKDQIYSKLKEKYDHVTDTYPQEVNTYPVIQFLEEDNRVAEWTGEGEASSYVLIKIDIWDDKSTSAYAMEVNDLVASFGFKRTACGDSPDPTGLKHKVMRFEAVIDNNDTQITSFSL